MPPAAALRLFVAVYPPPELAAQLGRELEALPLPAHRLTPVDQVHLTLQFLGGIPPARLDTVIESVERSAAGIAAFEVALHRLVSLPGRGPARLVAAEASAPPPLLELKRRLATRLAERVRERPAARFRPHLTLCRFRAPTLMMPLDHPVRVPPFDVERIVLMRSELHPDGARHHPLAVCPLDT